MRFRVPSDMVGTIRDICALICCVRNIGVIRIGATLEVA